MALLATAPLSPYHARLMAMHSDRCKRPPTRVLQRRALLCRGRQRMRPSSLPVTSRMPNGCIWRRCCRRQRGEAGPAPGRCACSSTRSSTSGAPVVPGAISRGSIRPGKPRRRRCASGACTGSGSASTRRCAAPSACGLDATPPPQRRSWIARGCKPPKNRAVSRAMMGGNRLRAGNGICWWTRAGCCYRSMSPRHIPPTRRGRAAC
jgi:hypothetical protein